MKLFEYRCDLLHCTARTCMEKLRAVAPPGKTLHQVIQDQGWAGPKHPRCPRHAVAIDEGNLQEVEDLLQEFDGPKGSRARAIPISNINVSIDGKDGGTFIPNGTLYITEDD